MSPKVVEKVLYIEGESQVGCYQCIVEEKGRKYFKITSYQLLRKNPRAIGGRCRICKERKITKIIRGEGDDRIK